MPDQTGFCIGPYQLENQLVLAPMAGVTDLPFRRLCRKFGAGMVVSEMVASKPDLRKSKKTLFRSTLCGETEPVVVQIVGNDPLQMADAARFNVDSGAQIIDINMGCPAKKVYRKAAGSALLAQPDLVMRILREVVAAVEVPVTLKIRTGISTDKKNAVEIARIAEAEGISALSIHGRTREDKFNGEAEYETIAAVREKISIPLIANGDITTPEKALRVLKETAADAIMIGRAAQGRPWIFREIDYFLRTGNHLAAPSANEVGEILTSHLSGLHDFYPEESAVRIARKHIGWYLDSLPVSREIRCNLNRIETAEAQLAAVLALFPELERAA